MMLLPPWRLITVPIIGLSADALDEQKQEAFKVGMNDYLVKPYAREQIYLKIEQWTEFGTQSVLGGSSQISLSQLSTVPTLFTVPPPSLDTKSTLVKPDPQKSDSLHIKMRSSSDH